MNTNDLCEKETQANCQIIAPNKREVKESYCPKIEHVICGGEHYEIKFLEDKILPDVEDQDQQTTISNNDLIDINMIETTLTKSGKSRQRKKFILNKNERLKQQKVRRRNDHQVKSSCSTSCKKLCSSKLSNICRQKINDTFWAMNWCEQGSFINRMTSKSKVSRKTVDSNRRQYSITYSLNNDQGEEQNVCQRFFLATLGYSKNNSTILKRISIEKNTTIVEKRGKYYRGVEYKENIKKHIESYNRITIIPHTKLEHSPNKRYLPSDITIKLMYSSFHELHPTMKCSYDTYRKVVKELELVE